MSLNKILYFSYDGILEPLGQSQILSYQSYIAKKYKVTIVSFEKKKDFKNLTNFKKVSNKINILKIYWKPLIFSNNYGLISYFINYFKGLSVIFFLCIRNDFKIIHCRGYVTFIIIYLLKFFFKFQILFDMRGFWVDERVEWKIWNKNLFKYKFFKYIEKKLLFKSDSIITLTSDALLEIRKIIKSKIKDKIIDNIPSCANIDDYNIKKEKKILDFENKKIVFCHLGAISTRYDFNKAILFIKEFYKYKRCELVVINKNEHKIIKDIIIKNKLDNKLVKIINLNFSEVPQYLQNIDCGIFFPKKGYYLKGFFPTKFAEFMASGKPIITFNINNDFDELIKSFYVGIIIDRNTKTLSKKTVSIILDLCNNSKTSNQAKIIANNYLSVEKGAKKYLSVYQQLTAK